MPGMAKVPKPPRDERDVPEVGIRLRDELRARGMSDAEIEAATRKRKRRKALEFAAVHYPEHGVWPLPQRDPASELVTVEFAAGQLKLHPKTVLRFIREERLRATRVGKSYRILRADLDAFAGVPARKETAPAQAWVTSIVDIPGVGPELAQKWARVVPTALTGKPDDAVPLRAEVVYEPERAHLKLVITGSPADSSALLNLVRLWLDQLAQ